jgi:hypothetical protein
MSDAPDRKVGGVRIPRDTRFEQIISKIRSAVSGAFLSSSSMAVVSLMLPFHSTPTAYHTRGEAFFMEGVR